jgi:hypothetical protein
VADSLADSLADSVADRLADRVAALESEVSLLREEIERIKAGD